MVHATRPQWKSLNLREMVVDICRSLVRPVSERPIEVVIDVPLHQIITADGKMLRQAVANLVVHAMDGMPHGGTLVVTSATCRNMLELEVADSGPGIPEPIRRPALGEPFLTASGSIDFGLAVVNRIAQLHGGKIAAANCPEGGSAFTLSIPRFVSMEVAA
jgi:signal transduction histidine kinase